MSRTKAVVILAALGCASFLLTSTSLVWASNQWYCWHWDHTSIGVSNLASGYWGSIIGSEINDWNAGTCLTFTGGSEIFVDADFYGNTGWLGIAQILDNNGCVILQAQALINQTYHDGPAYPEADDRHTTCQEIGHTIGLDHRHGSAATCMNDGFNAGPYPDFDQHDADMVAQINNCGGGGGGCLPLGSPCTLNNDCCSNKCKGPAGGKTCK